MAFSKRQFLREAFKRACHDAWHVAHSAHLAIIIFGSLFLVLLGIHFQEEFVSLIPVMALVLAFFFLMVHHAYLLYKEAEDARALLEKRLETPKETPFAFVPEKTDLGTWSGHYRVVVRNVSRTTVTNCSVFVYQCEPSIPHMPFRLHCSGQDLKADEEPFDLHPSGERNIDVLVVDPKTKAWKINAVSTMAGMDFRIPKVKHRLKLVIEGKDSIPCERFWVIEPTPSGSVDLYEEGAPRSSESNSSTLPPGT